MLDEYTFDNNEVIKSALRESIPWNNRKVFDFKGGFNSYNDASISSTGYDAEEIFQKSARAAIAVKNGEARYERDSVLFYDDNKMFELLYSIMDTYITQGRLDILDYGGGMGSMYFQHRDILKDYEYTWKIKEQKQFVEFGTDNLADDRLSFIEEFDEAQNANMVILGSSLQYIEDADRVINDVLSINPYIIYIDKTPICSGRGDTGNDIIYGIFKEVVHEPIYEAEYPMYVFDRYALYSRLRAEGRYSMFTEWNSSNGGWFRYKNKKIIFKSSIWRRQ